MLDLDHDDARGIQTEIVEVDNEDHAAAMKDTKEAVMCSIVFDLDDKCSSQPTIAMMQNPPLAISPEEPDMPMMKDLTQANDVEVSVEVGMCCIVFGLGDQCSSRPEMATMQDLPPDIALEDQDMPMMQDLKQESDVGEVDDDMKLRPSAFAKQSAWIDSSQMLRKKQPCNIADDEPKYLMLAKTCKQSPNALALFLSTCTCLLLFLTIPVIAGPVESPPFQHCNRNSKRFLKLMRMTLTSDFTFATANLLVLVGGGCPFACFLSTVFTTTRFERMASKGYFLMTTNIWFGCAIFTACISCADNPEAKRLGFTFDWQMFLAISSSNVFQSFTTFIIQGVIVRKIHEAGAARSRLQLLVGIIFLEVVVSVVAGLRIIELSFHGVISWPSAGFDFIMNLTPAFLGIFNVCFSICSNHILVNRYLDVRRMCHENPDRIDLTSTKQDLLKQLLASVMSTSTTALFNGLCWTWYYLSTWRGSFFPEPSSWTYLVLMILDSCCNDLAMFFMLEPGTLKKLTDAIKSEIRKVCSEAENLPWVTGHTFYFVCADRLRESSGPLPRFQELRSREGWLQAQALSAAEILLKRRKDMAVVSYTWLMKSHPDPDGVLADCLRAFLREHQEIRLVWIDWACLPQGQRSDADARLFKEGLQNVNMLYLGLRVLVLFTPDYTKRFWPLFEFFLSCQDIGPKGLSPGVAGFSELIPALEFALRSSQQDHCFSIHNTLSSEKTKPSKPYLQSLSEKTIKTRLEISRADHEVQQEWDILVANISTLSVPDMIDALADPRIIVTSGIDRTTQLGRLLRMHQDMAHLWTKLIGIRESQKFICRAR